MKRLLDIMSSWQLSLWWLLLPLTFVVIHIFPKKVCLKTTSLIWMARLHLQKPKPIPKHRRLQPGQSCAANFEFWTARLGHMVFSKLGWYFHLGLFSCKSWDPKESFAFGFMDLSLIVCLWQRFEIENGQKSQFWPLQFPWILRFCQKHPIFKMSQFLKYPTNFQI